MYKLNAPQEELLERLCIMLENLIVLAEGYGPHSEIEEELRTMLNMVNAGLGYDLDEEE